MSKKRYVLAGLAGALTGSAAWLIPGSRRASPAERERLQYLAKHVGFLVPYADSWVLARQVQKTLDAAAELKKDGKAEEAREKVRTNAVPAWLKLAPNVRRAMLDYQSIVANRNELGQLASMHNKYVRLALYRLRLSMKE